MKQPENLSIAQIFVNRVRYCVPIFQRHYVWKEDDQWEPLWQDIKSKTKDRIEGRTKNFPHFMGAIIYESEGGYSTRKVQVCRVIDGQQRLTTLQIFLAALRDVARSKGMDDIVNDTEQYLFNSNQNLMEDPKTEIYKLWPTRFDQDIFSDMLSLGSLNQISVKYSKYFPKGKQRLRRDKTWDIPRLLGAFVYFREQIAEFLEPEEDALELETLSPSDKLDILYRSFLEDFRIVAIPLDEGQDDPQVIFETLNHRGTPLLASDLIRNYIFYRAEAETKNAVELYENNWSEFEKEFWSKEERQGKILRSRLEFFMQHFIAAKTGHEVNLIKLFQEYKFFIQGDAYNSIQDELEDIALYSPHYETLVQPNKNGFLDSFAKALEPWDMTTVFPLVLHVMASSMEEDEKRGILDDILSYIVRRAICNKTAKNYNKFFIQTIRHLKKVGLSRKNLQAYWLSFKSETAIWPNDQEFETAWLDKPVYTNISSASKLCYVLKELDKGMQTSFSENVEIKSTLSIEHVMPQAWEKNWPLQTGETVTKEQKLKAELNENISLAVLGLAQEGEENIYDRINIRNRLMHTFGNLTLLTQSLNSSVSKSAYTKRKVKILENSALALNRYFQSVEEWDEDKIVERGRFLFSIANSIWQYPKEIQEVTEKL